MSEGLNQQERYEYMAKLLKKQSYAIHYMSEEYLRDYVELIHLFLNSEDNIRQIGNASTMELLVKNTLRGYETMREFKKELYLNRRKPDRVHFPTPAPSPFDVKVHEENQKLIQWLKSLKKKRFFQSSTCICDRGSEKDGEKN